MRGAYTRSLGLTSADMGHARETPPHPPVGTLRLASLAQGRPFSPAKTRGGEGLSMKQSAGLFTERVRDVGKTLPKHVCLLEETGR